MTVLLHKTALVNFTMVITVFHKNVIQLDYKLFQHVIAIWKDQKKLLAMLRQVNVFAKVKPSLVYNVINAWMAIMDFLIVKVYLSLCQLAITILCTANIKTQCLKKILIKNAKAISKINTALNIMIQ